MIYEWIDHPFLWAVRIRPAELFDQVRERNDREGKFD